MEDTLPMVVTTFGFPIAVGLLIQTRCTIAWTLWLMLQQVGQCAHLQSVVMIRNFLELQTMNDGEVDPDNHLCDNWYRKDALAQITLHSTSLRKCAATGGARANMDDVGTMHTIGIPVELDNVTVTPYRANDHVSEQCLHNLVVGMWKGGHHYFSQVLSVIRDVDSDSGIIAHSPEDGVIATSPMVGDVVRGHQVGNTIDMSVNLGNASHYDVHDASRGFSVWTEKMRDRGRNWFFVMPNLYGQGPHGEEFRGIAIKLSYGIAISWDERVIRHATSISQPYGLVGRRVGDISYLSENHLFGTFTSAKECVIKVGRALSAAAVDHVSGDNVGQRPEKEAKKKRKRWGERKQHNIY